ncbi:MAG TPA: right-handed parallel beta-helix repeat-containing protein, partial [Cytophagaceae bacterium]
PGPDSIHFNFGVATTITLTSCLPQIIGQVTIDGYSDPGAGAGNLMIEIIASAGCRGLDLGPGSNGSTIRGLVISGGTTAIYIGSSDNHSILGNYLGTNLAGTAIAAIRPQNGIHANNADNLSIGGNGGEIDRNIISGNTQVGIRLQESLNALIINNYIGTDKNGNVGLGNGEHGIYGYNNSHNPTVERNIVSGNTVHGVYFNQCTTPIIKGNIIGLGKDGSTQLGNGGSGVNCENCGAVQIGGTTTDERNYVSNNGSFGIVVRNSNNSVIEGNWIGVDMATGLLDHGNYDAAITVTNSADVRIGGSVAGAGNICSASGNPGTGADGISVWSNCPRPVIQGNIIGLGADGVTALQNYGHGIECLTCEDGIIGGINVLERNIVAASFNQGMQIVNSSRITIQGNYVGTDQSGLLDRGGSQTGIAISNSADVVIGGSIAGAGNIVSGNNFSGIEISGNSPNGIIKGNIIGLGADGTTVIANKQMGIKIAGNQANNFDIGGITDEERNIISGNGSNTSHHGLFIDGGSSGHSIINNLIGTDATGTVAKGNTGNGIFISNCDNNTITSNLIASNGAAGLQLTNSDNISITKNKIGTNIYGTGDLGNGSEGIRSSGTCLDISIGGSTTDANTVAYNNGAAGILIENSSQRNRITMNSIFCNAGLGIDLQGAANESVLPPGILLSDANSINGTGTNGNIVHIYRNVKADGGIKCNCEGEIYLGSTVVADGAWTFSHNLGLNASDATSVTATQTTVNGSTSEFSNCSNPMPVELSSFTVIRNDDYTVDMIWSTASERNNSHFEAQISTDGINFTTISITPGAGNSSSRYYRSKDSNPGVGVYYYRLKQVDFDGKIWYSEIKTISFTTDKIVIKNNDNGFTLLANTDIESELILNIYSMNGALLNKEILTLKSEFSSEAIKPNLPPSMYIVVVNFEDQVIREKFMIKE